MEEARDGPGVIAGVLSPAHFLRVFVVSRTLRKSPEVRIDAAKDPKGAGEGMEDPCASETRGTTQTQRVAFGKGQGQSTVEVRAAIIGVIGPFKAPVRLEVRLAAIISPKQGN